MERTTKARGSPSATSGGAASGGTPFCGVCGRTKERLAIFYAIREPCPGDCRHSNDPSEEAMLVEQGFQPRPEGGREIASKGR